MTKLFRFLSVAFVLFALAAPLSQAQAQSGPASFADLAEKLLPSVVNISTTQVITQKDNAMQQFEFAFPEGTPFDEFFQEFKERHGLPPDGKDDRAVKRKATSLGSGFIIDPAGYIVTNYHVIEDAEEITVILQDDTNLTAKVVGRDKKTDLAVLKVDSKKPLTAVGFGDSDTARVGDWILTIGNPFGLGGSVTTGIISARARDINSGPYDDYLQTDAPINRGNSGGPMFNMKGEVIGINTAIFSPTGGSVGIGFAIPSAMAKNVIEQLKTDGTTRRGWLGVRIQVVTPEIADSLGLEKAHGALVSSVTTGGPAAASKFEVGDVIVGFDGKDVPDMHALPRMVAETKIGKDVKVDVIRKGKKITLPAKIAQLDQADDDKEDVVEEKTTSVPSGQLIEELGLQLSEMSDKMRDRYKLDESSKGLVVVGVDVSGLGVEYGIQSGDVIAEAGQTPLSTIKDLQAKVDAAKKSGKPLLLLVDRKGDLRFIALSLEETGKSPAKKK